jgi:hypothetical protein
MQPPTYRQFRELALSRDWPIASGARHTQAGAPLPTACLSLGEHHGWPPERMAQTWGEPLAHVRTTLNTLSMDPPSRACPSGATPAQR